MYSVIRPFILLSILDLSFITISATARKLSSVVSPKNTAAFCGIKAKSYMDAGALVPDSVIIDLIRDRLVEDDAKNGVMFDGFPRTIPQAEALSAIVDVSAVLAIDVPDERIVERICGRYSCGNCGAVFHDTFNPIKNGICECGSFVEKRRADDVEETVLARLEAYHAQTSPLADYYRNAGIFHLVDGDRDIDVITSDLLAVLG